MYTASVIAKMVLALCELESGSNPNAPDNGDCVGIGQIKCVVVDEVNRLNKKKKYTYEDRRNPMKARAIVFEYLVFKIEDWMNYQGIAILYKVGPTRMITGNHSDADWDYAQRFENLMEEAVK